MAAQANNPAHTNWAPADRLWILVPRTWKVPLIFSAIRLKNFKAYRDSREIELRPLTILLGANNSGKSSLLHAILLLAQTLADTTSRQPLVTSGAYVDLGGYYDIIWGGQSSASRKFTIGLTASPETVAPRLFGAGEADPSPTNLSVSFGFDARSNATVISHSQITGESGSPFVDVRRAGRGYTDTHIPKSERSKFEIGFRHFLPLLRPKQGTLANMSESTATMLFRAEDSTFVWSRALGLVGHVAPLRQPVPRFGILGKSATSELGPGGENLLRVLRSTEAPLGEQGTLVDSVNEWISERFQMLGALRIVNVAEGTVLALVGDEKRGFSDINIANMGEGISQLLPIVARVLTTPRDGALLVEQPELHLHPAAQADLADLFLSAIDTGDRQYLVETHSEHLVLRVRRRIAEGKIDPDQVAILFVERRGPNSTVRALNLNEWGHIEDWPEGFFEERYREALAIAEFAQARRSDK
jgi:predicted ATPase